ncbi:MAG: hypothetical protein AAGA48_38335 [Myxococcota bacterium]
MSDLSNDGINVVFLGLGGLGLLVVLALGGVAATKRRIPLSAFALVPLLVAGAGALASFYYANTALNVIGAAAPDEIVSRALDGLMQAQDADADSRWVTALLFGFAAWAAGLGAFMAGPHARLTPWATIWSVVLTLAGCSLVTYLSGEWGLSNGLWLVGLLGFSGFGVAFAALRRAEYEEAHRVAGMRFTSAMCMLLGMSYASRAATEDVEIAMFGPEGLATNAGSLAEAMGLFMDVTQPSLIIAWTALGFALAVAFAGFYYELSDVVERFTLFDVAVLLVFLGVLGSVRGFEDWQVSKLAAIAHSAPATEVFAEIGPDLPDALLEIDEQIVGVHPVEGGFGDVVMWRSETVPLPAGSPPDAEPEKRTLWRRMHKWTGSGWEADGTALDEVSQLSPLRPLIVIASGESAADLPGIIEKAGGKALLLLRAEEEGRALQEVQRARGLETKPEVPVELDFFQVTFLPVELVPASDRKLDREAWSIAGQRPINNGVVAWFGSEEDAKPVRYADAVFAETEATGLHVTLSENTRVKDLPFNCLPTLMSVNEEGTLEPSGKWCRFTTDHPQDLRMEALEVTELKAPESFNARLGAVPAVVAQAVGGADYIRKRISHDFPAIDYCMSDMVAEGEEIAGTMNTTLTFSRRGSVKVDIDEKSPNQNGRVLRCLRDRFSMIAFKVDEEQWPKTEVPEGEEPPPPPSMGLVLDIRG